MDTTDASAAELWRTIGASLAFAFRQAPGFEARLTPTGWLLFTGEPVADFNWILVDDGPDPDGQFRGFGEALAARGLPALVLLTEPVADRLGPVAEELGLQPAGRVPLMVHRPSPGDEAGDAPPPGADRYRVEAVADAAALGEANRLAAEAFGLPREAVDRVLPPSVLGTPGVTFFLAREGGDPASTVMTVRVGPTVGVWTMATPPARQRQGAGRAVLEHALAHRRAQGADQFYLLATEAGKPLYGRVGFRTLAEPAVWLGGHSVQVASH